MSKILAIDYGKKRIGISISDGTLTIARGLCTIYHKDISSDTAKIVSLINEHSVQEVVVGISKKLDNTIQDVNKDILLLETSIREASHIKVTLWDESYTTKDAESILIQTGYSRKKRKKVIDKIAATILLQNYLNTINDQI
jgi:putative holliday junction resolvase